jgi:hypothetical protein
VTTSLLALDVTAQARAAGVDGLVCLSAGCLTPFKNLEEAISNGQVGDLVKLVVQGAYPRSRVAPGAELVDLGGRRLVILRRERAADGAGGIGIVTLLEAQLAGGVDFDLDVREHAPREGWLQ